MIKTTKDIIFGGYTTQEWNGCKKDEKAFVYSLKKEKNIKLKNQIMKFMQILSGDLAPPKIQ